MAVWWSTRGLQKHEKINQFGIFSVCSLDKSRGEAKIWLSFDSLMKNLHFTSFLMQFSDFKLHFQFRKCVDSFCCSWRGTPYTSTLTAAIVITAAMVIWYCYSAAKVNGWNRDWNLTSCDLCLSPRFNLDIKNQISFSPWDHRVFLFSVNSKMI